MRVLIVDDEQLTLRYLLRVIGEACPEAEAHGFSDPAAALEHARLHGADVAMLDVEMPGMSGMKLAENLRAICPAINVIFVTGHSQYAVEAFSLRASGYLLKPPTTGELRRELEHLRIPPTAAGGRIRVLTFGNFEIFVDGHPVKFFRRRSRELLAYLVDRKGAASGTAELAAVLWQGREYTVSVQKQFQTVASDMLRSLRNVQAEHIVIRKRNHFSVDTSAFQCDYYALLQGDLAMGKAFTGEYLANYSWAKQTAVFLTRRMAGR